MGVINHPPNFLDQFRDLEKRVQMLEMASMPASSLKVADTAVPPNFRVLEGNISGVSGFLYGYAYSYPAGTYGLTVLDVNKNIQFDSLGASPAGFELNSASYVSTQTLTAGANQTVPNSSFTVTVARPTKVLVMGQMNAYLSAVDVNTTVAIQIVSQYTGLAARPSITTTIPVSRFFVWTLPASGTYTIRWTASVNTAITLSMTEMEIHAFTMGG